MKNELKHQPVIIDLYPNNELTLRIYNNLDDKTQYDEVRIFVEEDGTCTERIRIMNKGGNPALREKK